MIKTRLTADEQKIMKAIDQDEYAPISGRELKNVAEAIAARKKDTTLTIRVNGQAINRIKRMAARKGIPYQSYLAEVIHRVAAAL